MIRTFDVETTTHNKGNPYDKRNWLVCWSYYGSDGAGGAVHHLDPGNGPLLASVFQDSDLVVGFNLKFDLHWARKLGVVYNPKKIWDVQIAEFILSNQTQRFPSLEETAQKYGFGGKEDIVKTQYWDKGIDTADIPWEILSSYAALDTKLTYQCYVEQLKRMTPKQIRLCQLQCQDLAILQEMEENGLPFDEQLCHLRAEELDDKISKIKAELSAVYPDIPINFNSNDHLSAFLYGGIVKEDGKEFVGFYKSGEKAGQPKYKNVIIEHQLPRLYTPLKGSEMAKAGNFAVDEGTLRKLKGKRKVLDLVLELAKLEKLNGTYYRGLVKLRNEMHWEPNTLHGQFNQTTAATGRLSSSKPNLQNFASELQDIFISRYND